MKVRASLFAHDGGHVLHLYPATGSGHVALVADMDEDGPAIVGMLAPRDGEAAQACEIETAADLNTFLADALAFLESREVSR